MRKNWFDLSILVVNVPSKHLGEKFLISQNF